MLTKIQIIVASQYNVIVQPANSEAYDYPAEIAIECQVLAKELQKNVVLLDKHGKKRTFKINRKLT